MLDNNYKFYILLVASILFVTVPAIYTFLDDVQKKKKDKLTDPTLNFKKEHYTFFCALLGALIFFYNSCDSHNQSLISQAEAVHNYSLAKQNESRYRELLSKKIDTSKNLSEKNINLTSTANNLISNTKGLEEASQNLIAKVDQRTQEGLKNIMSVASQSPQQRQLYFYQQELGDAVKMQEVISYFIAEDQSYAFDRDSLNILKTFDSILQRLKNVYPNYLTSIDQRINDHWRQSISIISNVPNLIRRGFGDALDPNPVSQRRYIVLYVEI